MPYREQRPLEFYGDIRRLQHVHARRSSRAREIDESLKAPFAKTPQQWLAHPNRFDVPNVDTPKSEEEITDRPLEPKPLSTNQFRERLNMHRYYGTGR